MKSKSLVTLHSQLQYIFTKYFVCIFYKDESTPKFDPEGFKKEYGEDIKKESDAACDDRICIESDDVELQTWFINDFSIYVIAEDKLLLLKKFQNREKMEESQNETLGLSCDKCILGNKRLF